MSYSEIPPEIEKVHLFGSSPPSSNTEFSNSPRAKGFNNPYATLGYFRPSAVATVDRLAHEFTKLQAVGEKPTKGSTQKIPKANRPKKYCTISPDVSGSPRKANAIKSQSLPRNSSLNLTDNVDTNLGNVLRLPVDELAAQITLCDMQVFSKIQTEELQSCGWTKKDKAVTCPNIVAFTRRFNNISFWVVQEILSGVVVKERAEVIAYFIKLSKRLYELNNLHSLFSIISAMRSASIFRMTNTWNAVSKKDKAALERLASLFSEDNNWANLRQYLETLKLPCIPYLGLFLTDLIYIDLAYPNKTKGLEPEQRQTKMNNLLRIISNFQSSDYSFIESNEAIQKYLQSIRYIEELQNIFEEDQYKKSLQLEPKLPQSSTPNSSNESVVSSSLHISPAKSHSMRVGSVGPTPTKFYPGHRKCQSLGTNIFRISSRPDRHLLDDSVLERQATLTAFCDAETDSEVSDMQSSLVSLEFQGCVRRKTIMKDHKKPVASTWQHFWIQIWANQLIYFPPKYRRGTTRTDFKREPSKIRSLEGWRATSVENSSQGNTFELINPDFGHIYKFRTITPGLCTKWLKVLQSTNSSSLTTNPKTSNSANLMTFD